MMSESLREVEKYLQALSRVRGTVQLRYPGPQGLAVLLHMYRSRSIDKSGLILDGLGYSVHGSGCLFVEGNGAEVDVDFLEGGVEVFDSWRIRRLSMSAGEEYSGSLEEITAACRDLVSQGCLTEPRSGWFSRVRQCSLLPMR
jgi:hypothetical protein